MAISHPTIDSATAIHTCSFGQNNIPLSGQNLPTFPRQSWFSKEHVFSNYALSIIGEVITKGTTNFDFSSKNDSDDIDIIVYHLEDGCHNLIPILCMAAGINLETG